MTRRGAGTRPRAARQASIETSVSEYRDNLLEVVQAPPAAPREVSYHATMLPYLDRYFRQFFGHPVAFDTNLLDKRYVRDLCGTLDQLPAVFASVCQTCLAKAIPVLDRHHQDSELRQGIRWWESTP